MQLADFFLATLATFGHLALWVAIFNRVHAVGFSCGVVKALEKITVLACLVIPFFVAWRLAGSEGPAVASLWDWTNNPLTAFYVLLCWLTAAVMVVAWVQRRFLKAVPAALVSNDTRVVDVEQVLGKRPVSGWPTRMAAALPGNQLFRVHVNHKKLQIARLDTRLAGMTITHISDLHFTGRIEQAFFDQVVEIVNSLDSDLIAVTGDIIDKPRCLDWIGETLGKLKSRHGVFYVLGNHDQRLRDTAALRSALAEAGLTDLGSRWLRMEVNGAPLILAGNELPWFSPAADMQDCPSEDGPQRPLRVLLSHAPDQLAWARRNDFDLMLAGHTHGGQIRLPLIGPIVSPSLHGVKYASGLFSEPPTVMHVSRGVGALHPLRFNCSPEITQVELMPAG